MRFSVAPDRRRRLLLSFWNPTMPPQAQKFNGFPDHLRIQHSQTSAAAVLACQFAETSVPTTPVEVVCKLRQGFALAENLRSLPHSRLRGDAPADSGGSRDPEISSIPRSLSEFRKTGVSPGERGEETLVSLGIQH